jgi:hypothetical protein
MRKLFTDLNKTKLCSRKKKVWPEKHLFNGKQLDVNFDPDEPSNVKWENLDVTTVEKFFRRQIVKFLLFLIITITIGLLLWNKSMKRSQN